MAADIDKVQNFKVGQTLAKSAEQRQFYLNVFYVKERTIFF